MQEIKLPKEDTVVLQLAIESLLSGIIAVVVADEVLEQPCALVTVTLKPPAVETVIAWVVAALDQRYELPAEAVSVTLPPLGNPKGPSAVIVAMGLALMLMFVPLSDPVKEGEPVTIRILYPVPKVALEGTVALIFPDAETPLAEPMFTGLAKLPFSSDN